MLRLPLSTLSLRNTTKHKFSFYDTFYDFLLPPTIFFNESLCKVFYNIKWKFKEDVLPCRIFQNFISIKNLAKICFLCYTVFGKLLAQHCLGLKFCTMENIFAVQILQILHTKMSAGNHSSCTYVVPLSW